MTALNLTQPDNAVAAADDASKFCIVKDLLVNSCLTGAVFLLVHLVISHGTLLGTAPVFSDDFDGFGSTFSHLRTSWFRPLSTVLWSFLCALGPRKFFFVAEIWLVLYTALVFSYTKSLFEFKNYAVWATVAAATVAVCFEYMTHYFYFSGAILGIMSGSFALASMIAFMEIQKRRCKPVLLLVSVLFAMASLLCKEDFVLPLLLFFGFQVGTNIGGKRSNAVIALVSTLCSLAGLFVIQKVIAPSQFFSGQSVHYEMGLSLPSILNMYARYLFCTKGATIACVVEIAASLYVLLRGTFRNKINLALLTLQTLSLVGPFSLLPNHFLEFYAQGWICFQGAFALLFALPTTSEMRMPKWAGGALAFVTSCAVIWATQAQREGLFGWYGHASRLSSSEDASLLKFKNEINQAKTVVVIDPPACNAWLRTDGTYLSNRLGLNTKWVAVAREDSELGKLVKQFGDLKHANIEWQTYGKVVPAQPADSLVLKFDDDANATIIQKNQEK